MHDRRNGSGPDFALPVAAVEEDAAAAFGVDIADGSAEEAPAESARLLGDGKPAAAVVAVASTPVVEDSVTKVEEGALDDEIDNNIQRGPVKMG
ncbi:hypothetical protein BGZ83_003826 [Gryganskiella cystojenkinii]|nr:hypothetical protein BGZ83_003826 [Gryganskiella cystojenkinii]